MRSLRENTLTLGAEKIFQGFSLCPRLVSILIVAFSLALTSTAEAGSRQWDAGGSNNNWETDANWSSDIQPTTADFAIFGTKGSLPNPTVTGNPTSVGRIKFQGTGWTITGDADGRIKLYGNSSLMINDDGANTSNNTISCEVTINSPGDAIDISSGNKLTLSGANTYTGATGVYTQSLGAIVTVRNNLGIGVVDGKAGTEALTHADLLVMFMRGAS